MYIYIALYIKGNVRLSVLHLFWTGLQFSHSHRKIWKPHFQMKYPESPKFRWLETDDPGNYNIYTFFFIIFSTVYLKNKEKMVVSNFATRTARQGKHLSVKEKIETLVCAPHWCPNFNHDIFRRSRPKDPHKQNGTTSQVSRLLHLNYLRVYE